MSGTVDNYLSRMKKDVHTRPILKSSPSPSPSSSSTSVMGSGSGTNIIIGNKHHYNPIATAADESLSDCVITNGNDNNDDESDEDTAEDANNHFDYSSSQESQSMNKQTSLTNLCDDRKMTRSGLDQVGEKNQEQDENTKNNADKETSKERDDIVEADESIASSSIKPHSKSSKKEIKTINSNGYSTPDRKPSFSIEKIEKITPKHISPIHHNHIETTKQTCMFSTILNFLKQMKNSPNALAIALIVAAILISVVLSNLNATGQSSGASSSSSSSSPADRAKEVALRREQLTRFSKALNELKVVYNQSDIFWANIESTFKHSVINGKDPSVVMFVNDRESRELAQRLVYDVLKMLHQNVLQSKVKLNELMIDPIDDAHLANLIQLNDIDKSKLYIDTRLDGLFNRGEQLAWVKNIQIIPARAMILFYTYGDYESAAKYQAVTIFMSLNLADVAIDETRRASFDTSSASLSQFVEDYLFDMWSKEIAADQLRPIFTRIANNLCFVRNSS